MTKEQIENYGNQPATSCVGYSVMGDSYHQLGITIREHFASQAMQGLLTRLSGQGDQLGDKLHGQPKVVAKWSVKMADALLETLAEKKNI